MLKTAALFFVTAVLYAAVGFGGGSTYSALLVLTKADYTILPSISLICNVIVVTGGTILFHRKRLIPWQRAWSLFVLSVPMAWLGGRLIISERLFVLLLGLALLVAGLNLLLHRDVKNHEDSTQLPAYVIPVMGAGLGLLSGIVGIGGGIFLAPILHLLKWARPKVIAGICSAFILVNSLAGLGGQFTKLNNLERMPDIFAYWPLFIAVLIGGQIGSHAGSGWLNPRYIKLTTALLILFVAGRLLIRSIMTLGAF